MNDDNFEIRADVDAVHVIVRDRKDQRLTGFEFHFSTFIVDSRSRTVHEARALDDQLILWRVVPHPPLFEAGNDWGRAGGRPCGGPRGALLFAWGRVGGLGRLTL